MTNSFSTLQNQGRAHCMANLQPKFDLVIPADIEEAGYQGVEAFIRDHNLDTTHKIHVRHTQKNANTGTIREYHRRYTEMKKFCFLIGDYQSATLLDRSRCPSNPYPMKPETFITYLDFKYGRKGSHLMEGDQLEGNQVKDIKGNPILCQGTWESPGMTDKIRAAVDVLHKAYEVLRNDYVPSCRTCMSMNHPATAPTSLPPGQYSSCPAHTSGARVHPTGNVITEQSVKNRLTFWKEEMNKTYETKGAIHLLPGEVRQLMRHLTSSGSLEDFQTYTMVLFGIKLFLRALELLEITDEHFIVETYPEASK